MIHPPEREYNMEVVEVMSNQVASGHIGKLHAPGTASEWGAEEGGTPEPAEKDNRLIIEYHELNPINLSPIICRATGSQSFT
jgi:hypothetical protein